MSVLPAFTYMYYACAWCSQRSEKGIGSSGTRATVNHRELWAQGTELRPSLEQVLFTTGPSLLPPVFSLFAFLFCSGRNGGQEWKCGRAVGTGSQGSGSQLRRREKHQGGPHLSPCSSRDRFPPLYPPAHQNVWLWAASWGEESSKAAFPTV